VFGTYNDFGGSNGVSMTGLFSNANYTFKVRAINIDEVPTEYSPEVSKYTLAVQPGFVTTVVTGTTTMRIVINSTNNPSTLMSVRSNANGLYLNHTTHMLQGSPDYGTIADFGGNITGLNVINLDPNSRYQFVAIAKNGDNVLTAQSASYSSAYTLANTPSEPTVTRRTSSSVVVSINTNGNPSNTEYAVYLDELGKYLNSTTGQPTEDTPNWKTKANWDATTQNGLVVNNLSNGTYTFKVQARNQDGEETDFNLVKVFIQFDAPALSTPDVLSSSSIKWTFSNTVTGEVGYRVFDTNGVQVSQCSGADITECIEYGLSPNTSYTRKVAAYNNEGTGLFSETATAFTRAANPSITSITSGDSTSVNVKINRLSNPDVTQFEIQESISGYYVDPTNGQLVSGETWGTYAQFGGNNGINVTGLFANASYTFKVRARNNDNVTTVFSSEVTKYTKAVAPGVPTAASDAPTGVVLTVNNGGNSYNTEFAIKETTSNKYADNLSGVLSTTPKWVRMSDLAGSALRLSGLSANTRYSFLVTSRNGDGETTDSTSTVNIYTLANTPNPLTLSQIDSKDVKVKVGDIRNPANTQYSVMDKSTNNFLNVSTGLLDSTEVWGTSSDLGGTNGIQVKSLTPGKKYEFVIRARNGDAIATSYSTSSFVYTHSAIANLSGANAVTTRSLNIKINKQGNDDSVLYAVYEDNLKKYVDINTGFFVDNPSWGTYSTWGGDSGFVIPGLSPSTDYVFKVNSKNGIDQESGLGSKFTGGTNAIITNLPSFLTVGLASNFNVNPATVAGSQRGLQRILAQENNFRVADIPILFSTDRDWSNITIDSNPDESKTVVKVHESEGFTGKYIMYVVKNDSTRFILCTKAENINDVNINCDGSVVFVGPYPQTINVNGNDVKVSITIIDGVQYWMVEGLSGTGGLGVKVQDDGTVTEPSTSGNGGSNGSTGGTGGDNTGTGGDTTGTSGNVVQQTTTNVTKTVTNVVKAVQNVPKQTTQAIQGINTALDNTVGTLPQEQLTVVTTTASVATVTVGLASIGGGLSSLPYYVLELIFGVLSFLGFRKTGKPYGFVYDAVTKEPISRAVVRVYNSRDKLMWTDVTDVFGTFNAKLDKGKYKILVQKSGYKFPTQIIAGLSDYPLEPIYHGELVGLDSSKLFNVMIPVDPSGVNKFIKFSIRTKNIIEATVKYFNVGIFIAGLTLAIYMYNKYPNALNLLFVCVYIPTTLLILKNVLVAKKEWGKVTDRRGKPISGVEVVLKDMEYGRYVGKRITEADGLYRFVVSKGSYELLVVSQDYKVVKYEGGSNVIQIVKNDNEVIAKNIIVSKKASKK
ncbi:MAG TPA: hypothetical protein VHA74_02560, partial [Candidatus Dojkabacteria bacterium]|nr:hypothetical protein [Candidatus Dojkabacteria bacterium]